MNVWVNEYARFRTSIRTKKRIRSAGVYILGGCSKETMRREHSSSEANQQADTSDFLHSCKMLNSFEIAILTESSWHCLRSFCRHRVATFRNSYPERRHWTPKKWRNVTKDLFRFYIKWVHKLWTVMNSEESYPVATCIPGSVPALLWIWDWTNLHPGKRG